MAAQPSTSESKSPAGKKSSEGSAKSSSGKKSKGPRTKKAGRTVHEGIVHIHASFNNTIISISDRNGAVLCQSSAGAHGFRGSRKSTPFAAQVAAEDVCQRAKQNHGLTSVVVHLYGPGPGRESAIRAASTVLQVTFIEERTNPAHNGPRPPKVRRV